MRRFASSGDSASREALAALCESYWYPLYAFACRTGLDSQDASDGVQGFFAYLLENHTEGGSGLDGADPNLGRFRSYLIGAFRNYLSNRRRYEDAAKRGGGEVPLSWDSEEGPRRYALEPQDDETPEALFERRWALALLDAALGSLEREYEKLGKGELFRRLKPFLTGETRRGAAKELAAEKNLTEGAARVAVHRLRKRFGEILQWEVAQTVTSEDQIEPELRHLMSVLRS